MFCLQNRTFAILVLRFTVTFKQMEEWLVQQAANFVTPLGAVCVARPDKLGTARDVAEHRCDGKEAFV